ncbi:PAS domain-containing sensor histidine kinase [Arenibacter sp. BSSL-BM3]|uniref:histidine kinase n=1 Tax=Arenibacter arenosicollis TaxID=2762274 RepID=A0ABR7QJJ7_9FLAO|nr:PAS domain-containing sensor histidine kinase [Arenibacter arenosicollis]MBC8767334.1 PAS domain-containing sensor histidine kinase [Arenibacter arenosicollis]
MVDKGSRSSNLRSKAEAKVSTTPSDQSELTVDQAKELMQELEVHQVELEMQNQELREAQHHLEDIRDQYTDLFDFAPIGYIILNEKGLIDNINLTACSLLAINRTKIIKRPLSAFMEVNEAHILFIKLQEAFKNGVLKPFELEIKRNDRGSFPALVQGTVTKNIKGQLQCRLSMQDITEVRQARILQQQHKALQNEKEKIQQYLDLAPVVFLLTDKEHKIQMINQKGCNLFGYERVELLGQNWFDFLIYEENGGEDDPSLIDFERKIKLLAPELECKVRCKNGEELIMSWHNTTLLGKNGDQIGILSAGEDITVRTKLEEDKQTYTDNLELKIQERTKELIKALEAEKRINDLKSNFITIASHELRTPITIVMSSIILIERYNSLGQYDKSNKHIARIKSSVDHFVNILDDFLSLHQLDKGIIQINKEVFDLEPFVQEIIADMKGLLKKGQHIVYQHTGSKKLNLDPKILRNIILNLLSNALKYSNDQINVKSSIRLDHLKITIEDQGLGIPEEDQENLFSSFFRARNVEHIQGTGLGLSIVQRYLELFGGNIKFKSVLGKGSIFTIIIPIS